MARQSRHDWIVLRNWAGRRTARRGRDKAPHRRRLRFEPLEDRRLLAFITVDTLVDENDGVEVGDTSLRDAIAAAMPGDTIDFAVTGTITLQHGELVIDKDLTIDGPGADLLTIDADGASRVFMINDGNANVHKEVVISKIQVRGGYAELFAGAGFHNVENLTVVDAAISENESTGLGGGIFHSTGHLSVVRSSITDNSAGNQGGGIRMDGGTATIIDSVISGNSAARGGGFAVYFADELTVERATILGNMAVLEFGVFKSGGGILNNNSTVNVIDSTISGNTADYGGGVYSTGDLADTNVTVRNSTVSGNTAAAVGGGFYNFGGHLVVEFSTITDNEAAAEGDGLAIWADSVSTLDEFRSSIIAGNGDADVDFVGGPVGGPENTIVSNNFNVVGTGNAVASFDGDDDLVVSAVDLELGPLADNGGPTKTHALLYGSIAIDAGDDTFVPLPDFDQRGAPFARVFGGRMDIGAFEAEASYFVVDTLLDEDDGIGAGAGTSLRDALAAANFVDVDAAVITFDPALTEIGPRTILLTYGQLNVDADVTIVGPGADRLTIDAQGASRVMLVDDFDGGSLREVTIRGLKLTGGVHAGEGEGGGGIFNNERLTLRDSVLSGNEARWGGGIYNHTYGELTVVRSTLSGNSAMFAGAGIYNWGGDVEILETTVSGNDAADAAGVLNANFGEMLIEASTISGNHATGGNGGGILQAGGLLTIRNSTISGNEASGWGGGIRQSFGPLYVSHSSITANRADADGNGGRYGGGFSREIGSHTTSVDHVIIAGNFRGFGSTRDDVDGAFSVRYSLIGVAFPGAVTDDEGSLIGSDESPIDPMLGDLEDNGGPTLTHALLADSPAIDAGDPDFSPPPDYDQRGVGFDRESGVRIDIGAFEVPSPVVLPELLGDYNLDGRVDAGDYVRWRNTLGDEVDEYDGADGDGDGVIGPGDYQVWKDNYGQPTLGGGSVAAGQGGGPIVNDGGIAVAVSEPAPTLPAEDSLADSMPLPANTEVDRTAERALRPAQLAATARQDAALLAWVAGLGERGDAASPAETMPSSAGALDASPVDRELAFASLGDLPSLL